MATSLYKGQIPFRPKGQTTCLHHKGGKLDLYCEECRELACVTCLSSVHKKHSMCSLSEISPQKKQDIQNFIDKTENVDLVQINQYISDTDTQLKENASNFEKLSHQLKTQTNKLKQDLDLLTAQTLSLYQQMEEDNTKLLQTYKKDLEMYSTQLKQQMQECKIALQRGSDILVYDAACDIQSTAILPVKPSLGAASFSPNHHSQRHIEQALGKVSISGGEGQKRGLEGHDRSDRSSTGQKGTILSQNDSNIKVTEPSTQRRSKGKKGKTSPEYTLLSQTKVMEEWIVPDRSTIWILCPTTDGRAWAKRYGNTILKLYDRKGKLILKVPHNVEINAMNLSPTTNTLWICDEDCNISELVSGRLVQRFSTDEEPWCLCITASNHVIVGMLNHISKYTTDGDRILGVSEVVNGKPLVYSPYLISECPVTRNIAVADSDVEVFGGKGNPHVVVMDKDFKELFVYGGEVPLTNQPTSQSEVQQFDPQGVVYDSVGNLVVGDSNNKRILLISGRGDFLRILHTDDHWTKAVGIDTEGVLWAVFGGFSVKLLQYSDVWHLGDIQS